MTVVLGAVLLVAAVVLFILQPMLSGQRASLHRELDEPTEAESKRRVSLLALRDVEYDFAAGKLTEEDYRSLKRELSTEALQALDTLDAEVAAGPAGAAPELEAEIARLRGGLRTGATCASCGSANEADNAFCAYCGSPLRTRPDGAPPAGTVPKPEPA